MKSVERVTQHKGLTPKLIPKPSGKITELKTTLGHIENVQENISPSAGGRPSFSNPNPRLAKSIHAKITKEEIEKIIDEKRKKRYGLFGEKEKLVSIDLAHKPLLWVKISVKEGLLRKGFNNYSFIVDAATGDFAHIEKGLSHSKGISELVGMDENEIRVLFSILKAKKITVADLQLKAELSEQTVRKILDSLQGKMLITYLTEGRSKIYSPLTDLKIPEFKQSEEKPTMVDTGKAGVVPFAGKAESPKITEDSVRKIIKGLNMEADTVESQAFYYPVWNITFDKRKLIIDAVTGKEI
jgi:predicted transcriptional regulator